MKKVVLASLLSATALIPFVVQPAAFGQAAGGGVQMSQEEYAKYQACATATAPAQKASSCEDYLKAFPNSNVKADVLGQLLYAYSQSGDEARFTATYAKLLELIRSKGRPLEDDDLQGSDLILPPPDVTLAEAAAEFSGEGLIPG